MNKKKIIPVILFSLSIFGIFAGCNSFAPSAEQISEIALTAQTGLLGSTYTVSFASDGAARCECTFYNLVENNTPRLEYVDNICADLYRSNEAAFTESKGEISGARLKGSFTGKITDRQFESLAHIVRKSGFFQTVEKESGDVILDAPPNFVKVIYDGKTKEISGASYDLSKIEGALIKSANETQWVKERK